MRSKKMTLLRGPFRVRSIWRKYASYVIKIVALSLATKTLMVGIPARNVIMRKLFREHPILQLGMPNVLATKPASSRVKAASISRPATKYLQVFGIGLLGVGLEVGVILSESIGLTVLAFLYILSCNLVIADRLGASNPILQLIPVVNIFHLCWCADLPMWMGVLAFIPLVNIVFIVYLYCRISNHLDKPTWLGVFILVPLANTFLLGYLVSTESLKK